MFPCNEGEIEAIVEKGVLIPVGWPRWCPTQGKAIHAVFPCLFFGVGSGINRATTHLHQRRWWGKGVVGVQDEISSAVIPADVAFL